MLLAIHPDNPDIRKVRQVVECLRGGGIVIYPTDTVYSMGCDMRNPKAVERLARLKQVKIEKAAFSLICEDLSHIAEYTKQLNNSTFKLMRQLLPGPYTFILEAGKAIPSVFSSKKKTVGIRVPDNHIAKSLVAELGNPLVATSVHDENEIIDYTSDPEQIYHRWSKLVDIVIDGGAGGLEPSTVLDCTQAEVVVLREGKGPIDFL